MNRSLLTVILSILCSTTEVDAQPGEGYWGHSEIKVRLSTPESIHTAPLELSPRYFEADTIPLESSELMDLGLQLTERTRCLSQHLGAMAKDERSKVLEAYIRLNLRCFGGDYETGKAKVFRDNNDDGSYTISPDYTEQYGRFPETVMYDLSTRSRLRHHANGTEIADADPDADRLLARKHFPQAYALHLDILSGKAVSKQAIREAINAKVELPELPMTRRPVIADYLRYNLARRLLNEQPNEDAGVNEPQEREARLLEAKSHLLVVRANSSALETPSLHRMADVEIERYRLASDKQTALRRLEDGLRLLRLCKEEGDPTAVGSIAAIVRSLPGDKHYLSFSDLAILPETRAAVASYINLSGTDTKDRLRPEYLREEAAWIAYLEKIGVRNDPAFIRLAAGLHDVGALDSCARVLEMCPPGDGIVELIRAHLAFARHDRAAAMRHLTTAEQDLRTKARRHQMILGGHFEYGLKNETEMMYGRVLVEQASLLLHDGDFLGAARKLRLSGMDLFNQEYVQCRLLTLQELKELAQEEYPEIQHLVRDFGIDEEDLDPMAKRDTPWAWFRDDIDGTWYASARITLARRLLQSGKARESLPYWDIGTRPFARRYVDQIEIATDESKTAKERGLAYWQAALILREKPHLWACSGGHEWSDGKFVPPVAFTNREQIRDERHVGDKEKARLLASKAWTKPRDSFFRYGVAEHCQKAAELLQGEQSAYVLWFGALNLAYLDREASEPMRQKLIKDYASTKIGGQAVAKKGLPRVVEAPEMK
ncbi:MAG: hypothetical protein RLZ70_1415 [Verrucomicrobiota bacterium]